MLKDSLFLFLLLFLNACTSAPDPLVTEVLGKSKSKYPFLLHHGFLSGRRLQWPKAKSFITSRGYLVFTTEVSAAQSIEDRAKQLKVQVDEILQTTGSKKINLIAHSMGGLDARYLISSLKYADKVASLTTVATPHRGTPIAGYMLNGTSAMKKWWLGFLMNVMARFSNPTSSFSSVDSLVVLENLGEEFMEKRFNPANPDHQDVYYQSWAGVLHPARVNLVGSALRPTFDVIYAARGENDGMVPVSSAAWGVFRGVLQGDHWETSGSEISSPEPFFNHREFLFSVVEELSKKGY